MNSKTSDIIRETRQNKECAYINSEKLRVVSSCKSLSDSEKLIWIFLSGESSRNTISHSCMMTEKEIAKKTNNTVDKVFQALNNLNQEGFLDVELIEGGNLVFYPKCPVLN